MPRVVGIDPGTVSLDMCGLDDGRLFLDATWPTPEAVADPERLARAITASGPVDVVVGPSGYGVPLSHVAAVSEDDVRLAFLSRPGDSGGISGIGRLARRLGETGLPLMFIPGVVHLDTVPRHRKLNRIDLGTADKVAAAALAIDEQSKRLGRELVDVSLILVELGGAFTAGVAVQRGQIVDGIGGTSGPIGWRSSGGWDGEVAFLAGEISKAALFRGGVETVLEHDPGERETALEAYVEGIARMIAQLLCSTPDADEIVLSGRMAGDPIVLHRLGARLGSARRVQPLSGFASIAKQGAQGAALIADGLAGGTHSGLVERLRLRSAAGSVLDHLHVISRATARKRLGLDPGA